MAFISTAIARVDHVVVTSRTADDGALTDMTGCFTDGDTEISCDEMTKDVEALRILFDMPLTAVDTMTIKFWDDGAMDAGDLSIIPYTDANSVDDTNDIESTMVINADCDFEFTANFRGDLGVQSNGSFAIRLMNADGSSPKPKAAEVQYEMTYNTSPLTGVTYDVDENIISGIYVQAYRVISTNPLIISDDPFDTDTSVVTTGAYSLDLYAEDWVLIFHEDDTEDRMDISEVITHTV